MKDDDDMVLKIGNNKVIKLRDASHYKFEMVATFYNIGHSYIYITLVEKNLNISEMIYRKDFDFIVGNEFCKEQAEILKSKIQENLASQTASGQEIIDCSILHK